MGKEIFDKDSNQSSGEIIMNYNPITTHILDTSTGKPAANVPVSLFVLKDKNWELLTSGTTNADGRIGEWTSTNWYSEKTEEQLAMIKKITSESLQNTTDEQKKEINKALKKHDVTTDVSNNVRALPEKPIVEV